MIDCVAQRLDPDALPHLQFFCERKQNDQRRRDTHFVGKLGGQVNFHLFNRPGESATAVLDVHLDCSHGKQRNGVQGKRFQLI